jgi:hypothetical protein
MREKFKRGPHVSARVDRVTELLLFIIKTNTKFAKTTRVMKSFSCLFSASTLTYNFRHFRLRSVCFGIRMWKKTLLQQFNFAVQIEGHGRGGSRRLETLSDFWDGHILYWNWSMDRSDRYLYVSKTNVSRTKNLLLQIVEVMERLGWRP